MEQGQATAFQLLRENWFWSEIMRDHANFLYENLAPVEEQQIGWARSFAQSLERLAAEARAMAESAGVSGRAGSLAPEIIAQGAGAAPAEKPETLAAFRGQELVRYEQEARRLSRTLLELIQSLKGFKEQLIQAKLECRVKLAFGPTLVSHMVIEAEEAQRALTGALEGDPLPPALQALHHHLIWLPDASGHAALLSGRMDEVEQELRKLFDAYQQSFDWLRIRALDLYTLLRFSPRPVPALQRLNRDAMERIGNFRSALSELENRLNRCEILVGGLSAIVPNHMLREELYYTEKVLLLKMEQGT